MKLQLTEKKRILLKNTVMLYVLTFSTYFLQLIVVPYESRVLHTEKYGLVCLAKAVMVYFNLVVDFGFHLSATEKIALAREDREKVSRIFTAVTLNKLMLAAGGGAALLVLCRLIPRWTPNTGFFAVFYLATVLNSMIPDYLYRGLEQMGAITVRTVSVKLFFTAMVFLLMRGPEDYFMEPLFLVIGSAAALAGVYLHLYRRLGIRFVRCSFGELGTNLRQSLWFFWSGIATTVYTSAGTIILDFISEGSATAFYAGAEKLVITAQTGFSPVADSLYPYMTKNRDYRLIKKVLLILEPAVILGCAVVFIWARPLCMWFFGAEYAPMAPVLRAMLPMIAFILPNYLLSYPTLSAMGLTKYATYAVFFGAGLHIANLFILYAAGLLNMVTLGVLASVAEGVILAFRLVVIWKNRERLRLS